MRPHPRSVELVLLLGACLVSVCALLTVEVGSGGALRATAFAPPAVLVGVAFGTHVAVRWFAPGADPIILPVGTVLTGIGIAQLTSIDAARGESGWAAESTRQLAWFVVALCAVLLALVLVRDTRTLARWPYLCGCAALVLMFLPQVPFLGTEAGGSARWISVLGASMQPGEPARVLLAVAFAGYLDRHGTALSLVGRPVLGLRFPRLRESGPLLLLWAAAMGVLVFQRDLGTSVLLLGLFVTMLYLATRRVSWVLAALAVSVVGLIACVQALPYVADRFRHWLDPMNPTNYEAQNGSYQLVQGLFAFAHGGLIGTGWGRGKPHWTPLAHSDYIFASLGEELGLAGVAAVLMLYLVLAARGLRIARNARSEFAALLAAGFSFLLAFQVFIVLGGLTRILPVTGLPAPLLAAGGSSLVCWWVVLAVLLRLSGDGARR